MCLDKFTELSYISLTLLEKTSANELIGMLHN